MTNLTVNFYKRKIEGSKAEVMYEVAPFEFVNLKSAISFGYLLGDQGKLLMQEMEKDFKTKEPKND